ncbi:hypothetical protein CHR28_36740 [Streptomyces sp. XY006]|nr:hypothetical protein CHR28_36740 [Streptomyces sp. XY006]
MASPGRLGSRARRASGLRLPGVDVALYTTACVDAIDWEQLCAVKKGRRSPLAALAKQAAPA